MRLLRLLLAASSIAWLGACAGQLSTNAASPGNASVLPPASRAHTLPSQLLFVPSEAGTIDIYPLKNPEQGGVIAQITGLTADQQQMTVDAGNDLYVVNNGPSAGDDYVLKYSPPYTGTPTVLQTVWTSKIFYPVGVAVDASGTVYVSNCGTYCTETAGIFVYPPGATTPSKMIGSPLFNSLAGLTVDKNGDLYAFEWNASTFASDVFKIKGATGKPKALRLHGLDTGNGGNGLSFDASGNLYVAATSSGSNYVLEYKPGSRTAFRVIDSMPFTDSPTMLDVGPDGNLYVPISCPFAPCTWVYGFKPHGKKAFESIGSSQNGISILGVTTAPNLQLEGSKR